MAWCEVLRVGPEPRPETVPDPDPDLSPGAISGAGSLVRADTDTDPNPDPDPDHSGDHSTCSVAHVTTQVGCCSLLAADSADGALLTTSGAV